MSFDEVSALLARLDLVRYAAAFAEAEIDFPVLPELSDADLRELGLPLGPRRKLLRAIADLGSLTSAAPAAATPAVDTGNGAERRQVTLLFCDLVDSTGLSTRVDPEDLREIIRAYQDCCSRVMARYGGFIARFMGDGILVYFGYPTAHEYDAERAVRASLEVITAIGELEVDGGHPMRTRIGIATGEVVVGDLIGEGASLEQAVVGETPNLAARLQGLAEPDTVVVAESTRALLGNLFEMTDNGSRPLKGFSRPIRSWVVVGERSVDSRFEAIRDGRGSSPLFGRARELAALNSAWRQARAGSGNTLLVVGEAGIGKSRMVEDFVASLDGDTNEPMRFFGSPYHQHSALHPVIVRIERAMRIARRDTSAQRLDKLETLLRGYGMDIASSAPLFAALLSLPAEDRYPPLGLAPSRQKAATLEVLQRLLLTLSRRSPLVIVFEDLHWADPTTLELIDRLGDAIRMCPILLLMTARPEFTPSPATAAGMLTLNRLTVDDVSAIVATQTGGKTLPNAVMSQIIEHTDGVPLFVEELTKTVLEAGFLRDAGDRYVLDGPLPALAVPSTLQESLTARLDRLFPLKEVAQIGALIGRRFSYELLALVCNFSTEDLDDALTRLVEAGLIFRRGTPPDAVYTFKHALVQDAAQASLLRNRRQALHARIAEIIESRFTETAETEPELLAHHFSGAGLASRAVEYWQRAGVRALTRSAHVEAADHLRRGIDLLHTLPHDAARDARELDMQAALGPTLLVGQGYGSPQVASTFARVRELGETLADVDRIFLALRGLWAFHFVRAEYPRARELAGQLLALAEDEDSVALHLETHRAFGMTDLYTGNFASALEHLDAGVARYDRAAHGEHALRYGNDPGVVCLCYGAIALWYLGRPDQALLRMRVGIALADELGHPFTRVQARSLATQLHQKRREPAALREMADEALELAAAQGGFPFWESLVRVLRGWATARDGDLEGGIAEMRDALRDYAATGALIVRPWFVALLAELLHESDDIDGARATLDEAHDLAKRTGEGHYVAELQRLTAQLSSSDEPQRLAGLRRALATAREQNAVGLELRSARDLADCHAAAGDPGTAQEMLAEVLERCLEHRDGHDYRAAAELLAGLR